MIKWHGITLSLIILAGLVLAACQQMEPVAFECTDDLGCVTIEPDEPIKVGVIHALSGDVAVWGLEQTRSAELAVAEREEQLLGHPILLSMEDSQCSEAGGANAALKVVADPQMVSILGTSRSAAAAAAAKIASESGLNIISGLNNGPSLTSVAGEQGADWQSGYLRTSPNGAIAGEVAASFAFEKLAVTKVALVNDGDIFTAGLTDVFKQKFTTLGGEIVFEGTVAKGEGDMNPVLTAIATAEPELIYFPLFQSEAEPFMLQAREMIELENVAFLTSDTALLAEFITNLGEAGIGLHFVSPETISNEMIDQMATAYETQFGERPPSEYFVYGYDAANLLLNAIEITAIQEQDGTLHIGRTALREALYNTTDFESLAGRLTCDEFGDCGVVKFRVVQLNDPATGLEGLLSNIVYSYTTEQ